MATSAITQNRVRVAGAGFTLFTFGGQPITFCEQVAYTSPRPVAPPSYIQPMDEPYAVEILASPAAQPGQLVLNLFELFGSGGHASKAWDRLGASVGNASNPFGPLSQSGLGNVSTLLQNLTPGNGPFAGAVDIVDIFIRQALMEPQQMQIVKIIRPLSAGNNAQPYTEEYNGCIITDVVDGEQVAVGTVEVIKQITVAFRYLSRNGVVSQAFAQRDGVHASITPATV